MKLPRILINFPFSPLSIDLDRAVSNRRLEATLPFRMGHRFSKQQRPQLLQQHPDQDLQPPNELPSSSITNCLPIASILPPMPSDPTLLVSAKSIVITICMLKVEPNIHAITMVSSMPDAQCDCHHHQRHQHNDACSPEADAPAPAIDKCCQCCPSASAPIVVPLVHMSDITGEPNDDTQHHDRIRAAATDLITSCTMNNINNNNQLPNNQLAGRTDQSSSPLVKRSSPIDSNRLNGNCSATTPLPLPTTFSPLCDNQRCPSGYDSHDVDNRECQSYATATHENTRGGVQVSITVHAGPGMRLEALDTATTALQREMESGARPYSQGVVASASADVIARAAAIARGVEAIDRLAINESAVDGELIVFSCPAH